MRLHELFMDPRVQDRVAVVDGGVQISYGALNALAEGVAAELRRRGVRTGDRVAFEVGPGVTTRDSLSTLLASSRVGGIAVPLASDANDAHRAAVLADCRPRVVIGRIGVTTQALESPSRGPSDSDSSLAMILYTSGSSALPKGVMSPHAATLAATRLIQRRLCYQADDRILGRIPMTFDYGLYQFLLAASVGASVWVPAVGQDHRLTSFVLDNDLSVLPIVPSLGELLLQSGRRVTAPSTSVRLITNTGERLGSALADQLQSRFPEADLRLMYGLTECKRVSISDAGDAHAYPHAVGRPLDETVVTIRDSSGAECAPGVQGRICVSGDHVMAGYWGDDALSAATFRALTGAAGPELWTEDLGHIDEAGRLYLDGRAGDTFKLRDRRVNVHLLEAAALSLEGVTLCGLYVSPDMPARCVLFATGWATAAAISQHMASVLGPSLVPHECYVVDDLPQTANGKIDRRGLARLLPKSRVTVDSRKELS